MLKLAIAVMLIIVLVVLLRSFLSGRGGGGGRVQAPRAGAERGTLFLSGVSPRPDAVGDQFVTISGHISGPSAAEVHVYGRYVWNTAQWPSVGDQIAVEYVPGKAETTWRVASDLVG